MADDQEKTEEPTQKKLDDARKKGDIAQSKEFANFIVFLGLSIAFYFSAKPMLHNITSLLHDNFSIRMGLIHNEREFWRFLTTELTRIVWILVPLFTAVFIFGILSYLGQIGFLLTLEKLQPSFSKINPLSGVQRIFSRDTVVELVKSTIKIVFFSIILYFVFKVDVEHMLEVGNSSVWQIFLYLINLISKLAFSVLIFMAALGILDFAYQKWSHHEKQKMSLQEVKDEFKQREGDPHVRSRIRQIQRQQIRARMMKDVPEADVVVANPTHVAVALKYKRGGMGAPIVVAKGAGFIAIKIKELAIQSGVPVLEKRQLARYLYRNVEVGQFIPESLYSAVAEILAYVYRMKKKFKSIGGWAGDYSPQASV